jgi:rSAM/selenodomain-associated transferase 2
VAAVAEHERLSVIMPALNEAAGIECTLQALQELRAQGHEVIVVDGGSSDRTVALATPLADRVVVAPRGRASQMNAGAGLASGSVLWFLHADTVPPPGACGQLLAVLHVTGRVWGRFDVTLRGDSIGLGLVARMMNLRSRLTGIVTGDQGLFVTRSAFRQAGAYPLIPLMEDIALSRALRRISRPVALRLQLSSSARRWQRHGLMPTITRMWLLRLGYYCGIDPARLARWYPVHDA